MLNIQPVIPFSISEDWNLITRTIVPLVDQQDIPAGSDQSGLGDIVQSFFFSPKAPVGGWILAAGPVGLYPTATDETLGVNAESTYDWENTAWAVPVNATASQLLKVGPQILQRSLGARYWAEPPDNGPDDWGGRAAVTFLFPK